LGTPFDESTCQKGKKSDLTFDVDIKLDEEARSSATQKKGPAGQRALSLRVGEAQLS
jgi:hypothetical protein